MGGGGGEDGKQIMSHRTSVTQGMNYDNIPVNANYSHCAGIPLYMTFYRFRLQ